MKGCILEATYPQQYNVQSRYLIIFLYIQNKVLHHKYHIQAAANTIKQQLIWNEETNTANHRE